MVSDAPAQAAPGAAQDDPTDAAQTLLSVSTPAVLPASALPTPASEPVTFDYSTPEGIRKAADGNEALRNYLERVRLDTANAERQRLQNEMRREQGTAERTTAYHEALIDRIRNATTQEELDALKRETPTYVIANAASERALVLRALTEQAIALVTPEEQSALKALLDEADDPDAVTKITGHTLDALTKRIERQTREQLTPEVLDEDPQFREYIAARVAKEMEAEMTAQRTEQNARSVAPNTPVGSAAASSSDVVDHITNMPESERMEYMLDLALNNPEEFERVEQLLMTAGGPGR